MRKAFCLMLVLCFLVCVCSGCSNDEAEMPENFDKPVIESVNWKQIYLDFLTENKFALQDAGYMEVNYIGLHDLNFDGVPELVLSDNAASAAYTVGVFQIKDGKIGLLCGQSSFAEVDDTQENVISELYSNFTDDWLTLRKNVNTGELSYVMYSGNGSSDESFGNTLRFSVGKDGEIDVVNEFEYSTYYDWENDGENDSEERYHSGQSVSKEDYEEALEEFEKTWVDTGARPCAMVREYSEYSNGIPLSLEEKDMIAFFDGYTKEYE